MTDLCGTSKQAKLSAHTGRDFYWPEYQRPSQVCLRLSGGNGTRNYFDAYNAISRLIAEFLQHGYNMSGLFISNPMEERNDTYRYQPVCA